MSIRDIYGKFKQFLKKSSLEEAVIVGVVILLALASFGLGRLSVQHESHKEIRIGERELQTYPAATYAAIESENRDQSNAETENVSVVSSQNSDVYHFTWCSGATRIKEENKVYYTSIQDAKTAGLRPAKNCKGLE